MNVGKIRTRYPTTISMSIRDGERFIRSNTSYLQVLNFRYGNYLGYITPQFFDENKSIRTVDEGRLIYVCEFIVE